MIQTPEEAGRAQARVSVARKLIAYSIEEQGFDDYMTAPTGGNDERAGAQSGTRFAWRASELDPLAQSAGGKGEGQLALTTEPGWLHVTSRAAGLWSKVQHAAEIGDAGRPSLARDARLAAAGCPAVGM